VGLGGWSLWPAGPGQRSQETGTDAGGGRGGVWGVASAHGGLRRESYSGCDEGRRPLVVWHTGRSFGIPGALGHKNHKRGLVPTRIDTRIDTQSFGNANIISVCAGFSHSRAVTDKGALYTWGSVVVGLGHTDCQANELPNLNSLWVAHSRRPTPAAGSPRRALPRSAADARPCLRHWHTRPARKRCVNGFASRRQQAEEVAAAARQDAGCC